MHAPHWPQLSHVCVPQFPHFACVLFAVQTGVAVPHEHAPQVHAEVHVCEPFTSHVCVA